jgi:hypothetical protein
MAGSWVVSGRSARQRQLAALALFTLGLAVANRAAGAVPACPAEQQLLAGVCVDQQIVNFVKCLESTSKGQLTTRTTDRQQNGSATRRDGRAGVSLVRVGVEAAVAVDDTNIQDVIKSAEVAFGSDIVSSCKELSTVRKRPRPPAGAGAPGARGRNKASDGQDAEIQQQIQLGMNYFESGSEEAAFVAFQQAFDLSGRKSPEAAGRLGLLERHRKADRDAEFHLKLALDSPEDLWVRKNRSSLEGALGEVQERLRAPQVAPAMPTPAPTPPSQPTATTPVNVVPEAVAMPRALPTSPSRSDAPRVSERIVDVAAADAPAAARCTGFKPYLIVDDVRASFVNGGLYRVTVTVRSAMPGAVTVMATRGAPSVVTDDARRELSTGRTDLVVAGLVFAPTEYFAKAVSNAGLRVSNDEPSTFTYRFQVFIPRGQAPGSRLTFSAWLLAAAEQRDGTHVASRLTVRCTDLIVK